MAAVTVTSSATTLDAGGSSRVLILDNRGPSPVVLSTGKTLLPFKALQVSVTSGTALTGTAALSTVVNVDVSSQRPVDADGSGHADGSVTVLDLGPDVSSTYAPKVSPVFTGVVDVTGATVTGVNKSVRVSSPLSTANSGVGGPLDVASRMLAVLPVATTRWRLKLKNGAGNSLTTVAGAVVFTGVWVGTPARSGSGTFGYSGAFTATPTRIDSGGTAPTDAYYVTPWVTAGAQQFAPGVMQMISYGFTAAGGVQYDTARSGYHAFGAGSAAAEGAATVSGMAFGSPLLDVILEYEAIVAADARVALFVGSSITASNNSHPYQSIPGQLESSQRGKLLTINCGIGGGAPQPSTTAGVYARLDLATTPPDIAVIEGDTNGIAASATLGSLQSAFETYAVAMRTLGAKTLLASTVAPRGDFSLAAYGKLTSDAAAAATSIVMDTNPGNAVSIQIGDGWYAETFTTGTVTGSGPYTVPFASGSLTRAHKTGEYVAWGKELVRKQYNDWLRQLPSGIVQVIDADAALSQEPGAAYVQRAQIQADNVHYSLSGNGIVAARY